MITNSTRETYDRDLRNLFDQVLVLGSMVEQAIQNSVDALHHRDYVAARQIYIADQYINQKRYAIEQDCISLIAARQSMARDMRFLAAILEIITELERMGDYAKGISKINLLIDDELESPPIFYDLHRMADSGLVMLHRALEAFMTNDIAAARSIPAQDDEVDRLYNHISLELTHAMITNTTTINRANHLMWAAHNLEQMADRVINICERTVYVATGETCELDARDVFLWHHELN
jgi:phosphate transport system protein